MTNFGYDFDAINPAYGGPWTPAELTAQRAEADQIGRMIRDVEQFDASLESELRAMPGSATGDAVEEGRERPTSDKAHAGPTLNVGVPAVGLSFSRHCRRIAFVSSRFYAYPMAFVQGVWLWWLSR